MRRWREAGIDEAFYVSILLKGANAALEIILSAVLFFTAQHGDLILALVQNELIEDPDDFFARHINAFAPYLDPHVQLYGSLYLFSHGIVKGFLVWNLLRGKRWAYPAALIVFALFALYQIVKLWERYSTALLLLTLFDLVVMWLIYYEYRHHIRSRAV
ncbi:MAG: DUF2127 domain-containing protein [Candidatus Kaiserbacteria bacterium]|nr:DUF2127 domain-containing protein [Candidatus Kaiserbacteria bacterium]